MGCGLDSIAVSTHRLPEQLKESLLSTDQLAMELETALAQIEAAEEDES